MKLNQPMPPTKAEIDAEFSLVAATISDQEYDQMAREMMSSPALILDAQRSLSVLCYIMFTAGDTEGSDVLRDALYRISIVSACAKKRREEL